MNHFEIALCRNKKIRKGFFVLVLFLELGNEPRALYMLSIGSAAELHSQLQIKLFKRISVVY
jgi:hypothetical protein